MLLLRSRNILHQFRPIIGQIRKFSVPATAVTSNNSQPPLYKNQSPLVTHVLTNENSAGVLKVVWDDGTKSTFSSILLRDNCRCSLCYDKQAQQRMLDTHFIPLDITPRNIRICDKYVNVTWPDDHVSSYAHDDFVSTSKDDDITNIKPILWEKKDVENNIPTFCFESVLESDTVKYDWYHALCTWGFTRLQGAGTELNGLDRLKTLFGGYFKTSQYGDTLQVMVHDEFEVNSLAQRPEGVLPHMDLSHFEYFPGVSVDLIFIKSLIIYLIYRVSEIKRPPNQLPAKNDLLYIYDLPSQLEAPKFICFSGKIVFINNNEHNDIHIIINICY